MQDNVLFLQHIKPKLSHLVPFPRSIQVFLSVIFFRSIFEPQIFTDPDGPLTLSEKQASKLANWVRGCKLFSYNPKSVKPQLIAQEINGYEVNQNAVGDCSVVASLAVAAHYEFKHKYKSRILSSLIFPQDENGNPIYNPTGKYVVRLFLNGLWRKVTIDDTLPVTSSKTPLCAYSNRNKLWVSLLEKAYLKVKGGYNFKGSTSSTDLYAYTSWMPEKVHLKETNRDKLWERIYGGAKANDCMITISTGEVPNEEKVGLKSNHAYAVLEVVEEGGVQVLLVKNPWGNFRWTGKFSTEDTLNWTEPLKKRLHFYDLAEQDNGIFWIDFDSVINHFDVMDINWNPALLVYRKSVWDLWDCANMGNDEYNLLMNPQYALEFLFDPTDKVREIVCWAILTKIPESDESVLSEDYMGLSAYESDKLAKICYDEKSLNDLVLTNGQHYLYKAVFKKDRLMSKKFVNLVLRQHLRKNNLQFKYVICLYNDNKQYPGFVDVQFHGYQDS
eukprot:TRINITY_DN89089_c1_g1_i1.p1 TRINITY_DN89089_c1_g1~~TRINITY_DN89089_c1_g1_i1.p1  ORF type:complete len:501 (+),score=33.32 TRINITY_DN89089_c1_g1_i1:806-2308(+)